MRAGGRRGGALLGVKAFSRPGRSREVRPGLAADRAGIKVGDVVMTCDGKPISDFQHMVELIKKHRPGEKVPLTVGRAINGQKKVIALTVTLDSWEAASRQQLPAGKKEPAGCNEALRCGMATPGRRGQLTPR